MLSKISQSDKTNTMRFLSYVKSNVRIVWQLQGQQGEVRDGVLDQKWKRTHRHEQQCGDCRGRGWVELEELIREISGIGKNTIKKKTERDPNKYIQLILTKCKNNSMYCSRDSFGINCTGHIHKVKKKQLNLSLTPYIKICS